MTDATKEPLPRERLEQIIEEQRVEILELSAYTQLARDAVNMLNDETSEVVVTRLLARKEEQVEL